ncbi:oxaloacetate acetylhydrolase [Apiospora kogelbergensis]|uniref:Oxaloacetate acetylhydrolase n=1 Tax=Apiospora kogelbergensis TaxID=1337665 RepID=A0AAW0QXQ4_9PEZI
MNSVNTPSLNTEPYVSPGKRLRDLISQDGICVQAPGVYDGICARVAIEQGFQVMYQSGAMTTAARLGRADLAFASLNDFAQNAQMIANLDPRVPLVADADTGFGSPPNIARMVQVYHQSGVAGGKAVVDMDTWKSRIRACVIGRDSIYGGSDIVIIARTDAMAIEGYDAALERLVAARDCGADMGFLEAIETEEQIKNAVKVLAPMPLMINFVSRGKTPWFPVETLGTWGVKLAIYPGQAAKSVIHTIREAYQCLKETGQDHAEAKGLDPRGFFDIMGLEGEMDIDRRAGGADFLNGA